MSHRRKIRSWLAQALRIGVSIGLVAYALASIDLREAWRLAGRVEPFAAAAAVGALLIKLAAGADRWLGVLRRLGADMHRRDGVTIFLAGNFLNQVLPSSIGGWAARVWLCRRAGFELGVSARSVVLDLVAGLLALLLMMLAATPLLWVWIDPSAAAPVLAVSLLGLALFGAMLWAGGRSVGRHRIGLLRALHTTARDARFVFLSPRSGAQALGLSLVFQAAQVLCVYALARGIGVELGLVQAFVLVPVVLAILTLPISMGGWGVREVGLAAALGTVGVAAEAATVTSILFGLLNLGLGIVSGAAWLAFRKHALELSSAASLDEQDR